MKLLKRWTHHMGAQFDWIIGQIENHEALVDSAIREMRDGAVTARTHLERVRRDGKSIQHRLEALYLQHNQWTSRATALKDSDKQRAIECLRRRNATAAEISFLEHQLQQHQELEQKLSDDMRTIEQRLEEQKRRKHSFSARESSAHALAAAGHEDMTTCEQIDAVFERWDEKILRHEYLKFEQDRFEEAFHREENERELEKELAEL